MKRKRVGIREAKKIFHKRSLRSQVHDRKHTAKNTMMPGSKNSYKWRQNPNKYDLHLVDTKMIIPKKVIDSKVFVPWGKSKTLSGIKRMERETLAGFSSSMVLPLGMKNLQLKKISSIETRYRKNIKDNTYNLYIRRIKGKTSMLHPVFVQRRQK